MLIADRNRTQDGFTLIEVLVGVAILAIVIGVAVPSFQAWMRSTQVRTAAESVLSGLQRARAEAISRNTNVSFTMLDTNPDPAITDSSWVIRVVNTAEQIESYSAKEGSPLISSVSLPASATSITFNNLGGVVNTGASLTQVNFTGPTTLKQLRVTIGVGGNVRMCDPKISDYSNPRAC